jgi:hypothetical protein
MEIRMKVEGVDNLLKTLDAKKIVSATNTAINRAATHCRAQITKLSRQEYTAKAGSVRQAINVTRSTQGTLQAEISVGRKVVPLIDYKTIGKGGPGRKAKARVAKGKKPKMVIPPIVKAMVKKAGGYKELPQAFIRTMRFGKKVFVRGGKAPSGLTALSGPSLGGIVQANIEKIKESTTKNLMDNLKGAFDAVLGKFRR